MLILTINMNRREFIYSDKNKLNAEIKSHDECAQKMAETK